MKGRLTMSNKEANRIAVLDRLIAGELKVSQVADFLSLSTRQVWRLRKRYQTEGPAGLVHRLRGKRGNRRIDSQVITQAVEIIKKNYHDFGPTLAHEKLVENQGAAFGVETLRKAMIGAGVWQPKRRRKPKIHQMRPRRACEGELVQADGSPHAWFEERGPECTLIDYIDDATGKIKWMEFFESETTAAYFKATGGYLKTYGKPLAFYVDRNSIFRINTRKDGCASTSDSQGLTQFGRALKQLDIEPIFAYSAQAKGRVERVHLTLQDRLVKELRLRGISTLKDGNDYLPFFTEMFNRKFAVEPRSQINAHRPLLPADKLERILAFHHLRILSKNLTCQYENGLYQIKTKRPAYAMRHAPVLVIEDLKGKVTIEYKGRKLDYEIAKRQPKAKIVDTKQLNLVVDQIRKQQKQKISQKPPADHPWRRTFVYAVKD